MKKRTPQQDRRDELEKQWKLIKPTILDRDLGKCVVCGRIAYTVHHVFSRRARPELFCDERFLASICVQHHGDDANTKWFAGKVLRILKERFGYAYPDWVTYYMEIKDETRLD